MKLTLLIDLISSFHKFLGYLEISPKYLNRAYTILSIFPTLYILRIIYGLFLNQHYLQMLLYSLVFLVLVYFIVLNSFYYFLDKNSKYDVTQLFAKYLPEDALNIQASPSKERKSTDLACELDLIQVPIHFGKDYQLLVNQVVEQCVQTKQLPLAENFIKQQQGYALEKNTLFPFYDLAQVGQKEYVVRIGSSYQRLFEVGMIRLNEEEELKPVGLFLSGGDFYMNGQLFHEPYQLKLMAKNQVVKEVPTISRQARRHHSL